MKSRKDNKGFTLVELIVVIVILAILIGVTIGGVMDYVNDARTNTDINNASALEKVVSSRLLISETLAENHDAYLPNNEKPEVNDGNAVIIYYWSTWGQLQKMDGNYYFVDETGTRQQNADWDSVNIDDSDDGGWYLFKSLYEFDEVLELPKCQAGNYFAMIIYFNEDGYIRKVVCTNDCYVYEDGSGVSGWRTAQRHQ